MAIYSDERIEFFDRKKRSKPKHMEVAHFHSKHEMYYLEKGKTKYFIGDEIFILNPGDMVFVPKGVFHKTDGEENQKSERLLFIFDDDFVGEKFIPYLNSLKENKFIQFAPEHLYKIKELFRKIEDESSKKHSDYKTMLRLYLDEMLVMISRFRIKSNTPHLSESYTIIQNAARYISSNTCADLSLNSLAEKYAMSPSHFSKLFKSVTGVKLCEYINIARVSAAEKLLAESDMPITAVAMECGFNDSNYFATVFRKLKGVSPKKYSKNRY